MLCCHMVTKHFLTCCAEEGSTAYAADVGMRLGILLQLTGPCQNKENWDTKAEM